MKTCGARNLYRAQLSCRIARDVIAGKTAAPDAVSRMEWAMFNLLHAVEEIATAMMPNVTEQARAGSPSPECAGSASNEEDA